LSRFVAFLFAASGEARHGSRQQAQDKIRDFHILYPTNDPKYRPLRAACIGAVVSGNTNLLVLRQHDSLTVSAVVAAVCKAGTGQPGPPAK